MVTEDTWEQTIKLLKFNGHLDMYCPQCGENSVFRCSQDYVYQAPNINNWFRQEFMKITAACSRDEEHKGMFLFRLNETDGIEKIGQYPSMADSASYNVKKYAKILAKEDFSGFKTALGLASHGIGAGALIYLRRVFESLIAEAYSFARTNQAWDDNLYLKSRMQERVKLLANYLPEFLVEHSRLYGILSKGVHELPEQECQAYFPVLRMSIELILDQKLLDHEKKQKIDAASTFINQFNGT
ncbi:short-chain dehydrogenase [Pseudomonas cichorii]|uniref:short-chain dehydrogenase n=1 Tax=Pseudomonas cichorii TaxID=36746 RepID=UPI0019105651|nr:short-chain dehydrogenase [Pseudomonas cichorii]